MSDTYNLYSPLIFDADSERITEDADYLGIRMRCQGTLDATEKQKDSVSVGGDESSLRRCCR